MRLVTAMGFRSYTDAIERVLKVNRIFDELPGVYETPSETVKLDVQKVRGCHRGAGRGPVFYVQTHFDRFD